MKSLTKVFIIFTFIIVNVNQAFPQDSPFEAQDIDKQIEEEMRWLQAETYVITASRVLESIKKSAASITVITARQIRRMGARHLMDVLRTVPGMSYRYGSDGQYKIDARGVLKSSGQDVLIMMNSHPLNSNFTGGATWTYDTVILENVKRIEVIRGPGSALYGANAFSGVINIITKGPENIEGFQIKASGGSYDTQQYNILFGKTWNDIGIAFNFNYLNTDGFDPYIEQDSQTYSDQYFASVIPGYANASLAPGYGKNDNEKYDVSLTLQYKALKFDGRYVDRKREPPLSVMDSLNDESIDKSGDYYLNLSYEGSVGEKLDILGKVYRNHNSYDSYYQGYPDGTAAVTSDGIAIMPDGLIAAPSNKNDRTGIEIQTTYKASDSNTLVAGMTYEKMKQYDVRYSANYIYDLELSKLLQTTVIDPLDSVQDLTEKQNYIRAASREFKAFFIQDIWDIRDNLRLTVGARYDDYSDFGDSFNPRAGLTWEFVKGFDLKLLYGRAFRAPSFYELYMQNNPSVIGNPNLKPEEVDTYEVSFGAEFNKSLSCRITGFRNTIKDNIDLISELEGEVFRNKEKLRSQGAEAEMKYDFGRGTYLAMNYTWQDAKNLDTKDRFYDIPKHKGNIMTNIRLSKYFNLFSELYFQDGYKRENGDTREDPSGFGIVNATLIAKKFLKGLEIRGSVYNLFDKEYAFPTAVDSLSAEQPMPGRNFIVELQYEF